MGLQMLESELLTIGTAIYARFRTRAFSYRRFGFRMQERVGNTERVRRKSTACTPVPLLFRTRRTGLLQAPTRSDVLARRLSIARQQSGARICTHQTTSSARHRASLPLPSALETGGPSTVRAAGTRANASGASSHPAGPEFRRGLDATATRREEDAGGATAAHAGGSSAGVPLNGNRDAKRSQRKGHTRAHRSSSCPSLDSKERTFTATMFLGSHAARSAHSTSMPRRVPRRKKKRGRFQSLAPKKSSWPPAQRNGVRLNAATVISSAART